MSSTMTEVRGRRRVAVSVVGLLVLALLGWGGWRWSHPALFEDWGMEGRFDHVSLAAPEVFAMVGAGPENPDHAETITLNKVTAHFVKNGARATARFDICTERPGAGQIGGLRAGENLTAYCSDLRPIHNGTRFHIVPDGSERPMEYVLMTLVPTTTGTSHIDAITFSYARSREHLFQRGDDRSTQDWIIQIEP